MSGTMKNVLWYYLRYFTDMALHSGDAGTVSAAVATRSRAGCSIMEGHTSLSTTLVSMKQLPAIQIRHKGDVNLSGRYTVRCNLAEFVIRGSS